MKSKGGKMWHPSKALFNGHGDAHHEMLILLKGHFALYKNSSACVRVSSGIFSRLS